MHAVRFHEYGGRDVLQVDDVDVPDPASDEVVVAVHGAGVNPVDTYFRSGSYEPYTLPMTCGVDVAGEVTAVGDGVTDYEAGDTVFGTGIGMHHQGGYAEYAAVPTDRVAHLPKGVDTVAAGGAGVAALTAWRALVEHAALGPAETVLIHGGSGGVGHVAVQLADAMGARVVATAAPEYHERLGELGADRLFDYARQDLTAAIRDDTGGVDVVLDHRLDDYLQLDADVAARGARVVGIGENEPRVGFTNDGVARSKDVSYQFMSMFNTPDMAAALSRIATLLSWGDVEVEVAETYALEEAAEAQRAVMEDSFLGKLVVTP